MFIRSAVNLNTLLFLICRERFMYPSTEALFECLFRYGRKNCMIDPLAWQRTLPVVYCSWAGRMIGRKGKHTSHPNFYSHYLIATRVPGG
jgi:hypothetical protein